MALRTSRLSSSALFPDPESPKCSPTGAQKAFWPHKLAQRAYFGLEGVEQGWNANEETQTDQFGQIARPRMSQKWPYSGQKEAIIGSKLPFGNTNSTQGAYFGLEEVEQGLSTKEDIQTDQLGHLQDQECP